ncbi:MAG: AI-2E family transporter, partial [Clostridia bacterium]|nr:AI-2E family transporter [Clostridia bacterium]
MRLDKENVRSIGKLMLFAAVLVFAVLYFGRILSAAVFIAGVFKPFIIGAVIAFILHIPMGFFERMIEKAARRRFRGIRAISMLCAMLAVSAVLVFVMIIVIPQLINTIAELTQAIPVALRTMFDRLEALFSSNPQIMTYLTQLEGIELDWKGILNTVTNFLKTGFTDVITTTYMATGSIVGSVMDFFISFVFAIYILAQKEHLGRQFSRLFAAFLKPEKWNRISHVLSILYSSFKNYITGQCIEAVILGAMFVVMMTLFKLPYALLIGVLIGVTALIPIMGAFIGCAIGAFLILIISPVQALIFVGLFLVLQQ